MRHSRKIFSTTLVAAALFGLAAVLVAPASFAKGKPPKDDDCDTCAPTVGPCVLEACGEFDCVYVCPFPF